MLDCVNIKCDLKHSSSCEHIRVLGRPSLLLFASPFKFSVSTALHCSTVSVPFTTQIAVSFPAMPLPLNGVPFSGNQARPFIRAPFQPIQPQLLMPQYQVPPNPSSQPLVPVQMHNGPLLHTPSSSTSSRLVRPMPLFVPPQSTQASRQQPALGPIPQTSYAPAVRPTMPPNPQVPRQQATAVQNPVVQNPVNAQRAVAGPSGSRVLGRPSENPE